MRKAAIKGIIVNWFATLEMGEEYLKIEVGKIGVVEILDKRQNDQGISVRYKNGSVVQFYNINIVEYNPI